MISTYTNNIGSMVAMNAMHNRHGSHEFDPISFVSILLAVILVLFPGTIYTIYRKIKFHDSWDDGPIMWSSFSYIIFICMMTLLLIGGLSTIIYGIIK